MKMTKRIFIALLILAVTVSSLAVFAFAEETTVADYVNVLEYYEEEVLLDYNFGENVDYSAALNANRPANRANQFVEGLVADASTPTGQYLSVSIKERSGRSAYTDNHVYLGWTSDVAIDDFNIDMIVSGDTYNSSASEADEHLPKIVVVVGGSTFGSMATNNLQKSGTTIAAVDYRNGYFTYYKGGEEHKTEYKIEAGAWYNVSLTYDVDNGLSITIFDCANPENALTVTDGEIPLTAVKDIRIGAHGDDNGSARGSEMKFASVKVLGGVYHRDYANQQADIEEKILGMHELFVSNDTAIEDKITICEVVEKLNAYGFTTERADVQAVLDELAVGVFGLYNTKIEEFIASVDTLTTFAEKQAYAAETGELADALRALDFSEASAEMVERSNKNLADFEAALAKLQAAEGDSVKFIQLVESVKDHSLTDYLVVKADLALFEGCTPDLTYEGAAEANKHFEKLVKAEAEIRVGAELFIEAVNNANNAELDFNSRAEAFSAINDIYFDNETYPGVTEALAVYAEIRDYMNLEISNAENFIKYVNKADYAIYISAKQENLDIAKTYMDICQPDFAGVAEAKVLYNEVQEFINLQIANAQAYIAAVNALDSLSGDALLAAIANAQSLQESGNVLGVEGVTDANIKLNQIVSSLALKDRYCIHFINLVNSLDNVNGAADMYAVLAEAREAELDADASYPGVAEASAKLAKAIADFNAEIEAINAEFEKANEVASNTATVGSYYNVLSGKVVALIKKVFDEE